MACPNVNRSAKMRAGKLERMANSQIDEILGIIQASAYVRTTPVLPLHLGAKWVVSEVQTVCTAV